MKRVLLSCAILLIISNSCNKHPFCNFLGFYYYDKMEYETSISYFTPCINQDPSNQLIITFRALAYIKIEKYEEAYNDLQKAISLDSTQAYTLNAFGVFYSCFDSIKQLEYYYKKAIFYDSNYALAYNNLGISSRVDNNFKLSKYYHDKAISLEPKNSMFYTRRAQLFWKMDKMDDAFRDVNKSIKIASSISQKVEGHYFKGLFYSDNHEYDKAITEFTEVLNQNPKYKLGFYQRGLVYSKNKEYDLALLDFYSAKELNIGHNINRIIIELEKLIIKLNKTAPNK